MEFANLLHNLSHHRYKNYVVLISMIALGKVLGHFHDLAHSRLGFNSVGESCLGCVEISSGVSTTRGLGIVFTKLRILLSFSVQ